MKNKKILIIGGSGFIGSAVSSVLKLNNLVTIMDKKKPKINNINFIRGNFFNSKKLDNLIKKNQIIIIFAAISNINFANQNAVKTIEQNTLAITKIIEKIKVYKGKKIFFPSSIYLHGKNSDIYTISKLASELIVKSLCKKYKIKYNIVRLPTIYGKFNRGEDVVSIFSKKALDNKDIIIHGTGKQKRNFMYSGDVADAINFILNKNFNDRTISLLSDQTIDISSLAKKIVKSIKSKSKIKNLVKAMRYDDFNFNPYKQIRKESKLIWKSKNNIEKNIKLMVKF